MNPDLNYPDDTHSGEIKEENREDSTGCWKHTIVGQNGRFLGRFLGIVQFRRDSLLSLAPKYRALRYW